MKKPAMPWWSILFLWPFLLVAWLAGQWDKLRGKP